MGRAGGLNNRPLRAALNKLPTMPEVIWRIQQKNEVIKDARRIGKVVKRNKINKKTI